MSKIIDLRKESFAYSRASKEYMIKQAKVLIAGKGSCKFITCSTCFLSCENNDDYLCSACNTGGGLTAREYYEAQASNRIKYAEAFLKLFDKPKPVKLDLTQ